MGWQRRDRHAKTGPIAGLLAVLLLVLSTLAQAQSAQESRQGEATPAAAARTFYAEDIKATMAAHVARQVDAEGRFHVMDDKTGAELALKFVKVHDPVRRIRGSIYFACTDFHVVGEPDKLYDIDFWMDGKTGELIVYDTKVHKEPRRSLLYGWYKQPRNTFVNDEIEYLYEGS